VGQRCVSSDGETFDEPEIAPTPQNFEEGIKSFTETYKKVIAGKKIKAAAGGIPGAINPSKEKIIQNFNLPDWVGKPLKKELLKIIGGQVYLQNDADMVGLGEAVVGAGRGFSIVAYVTVSTGVGGVRIVNRKIDTGTYGFEPGYQVIDADGSIDPDFLSSKSRYGNKIAYLQRLISGKDMEKRFGKKPAEITDKKIWDEMAKLLAYGLNNTIVHWSPDVVVLGGGMMKTPGISVERVKFHLKDILKIFPKHPEIKRAELGDVGGLHGALVYLNQLQ